MNFGLIADCLSHIAITDSTLQKEELLRRYSYIDGFTEVIKFIYDPYFTTGLKQKKLERVDIADKQMAAEDIMSFLKENNTGSDWAAMVANSFIYSAEAEDEDIWQWAATGLVTKDLQIGVSVTTLNKVYGKGFIPKIGIMRGMLCPESISSYYLATEKIDGNRRLIMVKDTGVEIFTRSGKRDLGLVEIEAQAAQLPSGYVYDTECIAVGDYVDSIALRQASASVLNSRGRRTGVKALCFDMLTQEEYDAGVSKMGALGRKALLAATFGDCESLVTIKDWLASKNLQIAKDAIHKIVEDNPPYGAKLDNIDALPILGIVSSKQEGIELAKPIWETGGEGVMLVEYRSPYEVNPNPRKTLLKIKATQEFTLLCSDVYEGDNKYTGMLGAIEVEYRRPGDPYCYPVKVGSGFPDYLRQEYWEHPERIVGKHVEIESFGESRNAQGIYSLNCPIFRRVRGEVD